MYSTVHHREMFETQVERCLDTSLAHQRSDVRRRTGSQVQKMFHEKMLPDTERCPTKTWSTNRATFVEMTTVQYIRTVPIRTVRMLRWLTGRKRRPTKFWPSTERCSTQSRVPGPSDVQQKELSDAERCSKKLWPLTQRCSTQNRIPEPRDVRRKSGPSTKRCQTIEWLCMGINRPYTYTHVPYNR